MGESVVITNELTKRYRAVAALQSCSLKIERGEVFGLLGPNGAGKTTLLRLLLGYLHPTAGSARIFGYDCYRETLQVRRRAAYLPGEARLFRQMRGREVLRFCADIRGGNQYSFNNLVSFSRYINRNKQLNYDKNHVYFFHKKTFMSAEL